jgi:hypothetical protein
MKRKILFFVMILTILGLSSMQSCKKDTIVTPTEYVAAMPEAPAPAADEVIPFTGSGQAITLTWNGTGTDEPKWDVYFGAGTPELVASQITGNSYTVNVTHGGAYTWYVTTTDSRKVESTSSEWTFEVNSNPSVPALTAPADNATAVSLTPAFTWTATDPEEDELTFNLYLGTTADPAPYQTGITDVTFTPTTALSQNTVYYWKVVANDPFGGTATSVIRKFTTGSLPVNAFVATYSVAENSVQNGAYAYETSFTKTDNNTITANNWWDSGWATKFTLDFTKNTIVMVPFTFTSGASTYIGSGSGKINPVTGQIDLVYSVTKNGVLLENGTEVFTKKAAKSLQAEPAKQPKF